MYVQALTEFKKKHYTRLHERSEFSSAAEPWSIKTTLLGSMVSLEPGPHLTCLSPVTWGGNTWLVCSAAARWHELEIFLSWRRTDKTLYSCEERKMGCHSPPDSYSCTREALPA